MASPVPSFYRIWFTIVDPVLSLVGICGNIFTPTTVLKSYSPSFVSPPASETILLLDTKTAFVAGLGFLQIVLLRAKPADITVWRTVQASTLLANLGMLSAFARALSLQGRTDLRVWRSEEWTNYAVTAGLAVIRSAFLLGIGMGGRKGKKA